MNKRFIDPFRVAKNRADRTQLRIVKESIMPQLGTPQNVTELADQIRLRMSVNPGLDGRRLIEAGIEDYLRNRFGAFTVHEDPRVSQIAMDIFKHILGEAA